MKNSIYIFLVFIFLFCMSCKTKKLKYEDALYVSDKKPTERVKDDARYLKKLQKRLNKEEKRLKKERRKEARHRK